MSDENVGMSGLTASEASEFMRSYEKGMWTFVAIASAAHMLYGYGSPGSECNLRLIALTKRLSGLMGLS